MITLKNNVKSIDWNKRIIELKKEIDHLKNEEQLFYFKEVDYSKYLEYLYEFDNICKLFLEKYKKY